MAFFVGLHFHFLFCPQVVLVGCKAPEMKSFREYYRGTPNVAHLLNVPRLPVA